MAVKENLTLMAVHAHPDDEAIGTGGILVKYAAEGVRTILVTCTRGELGEIQDPTYVPPEPGLSITQIRERELARAVDILKIGTYHNLGYKDSGMAGTQGNEDPLAFCRADHAQAVGKLVQLIRRERPQVIVTYDENGIYGHPDHIKAHQICSAAFLAAGDAAYEPASGLAPWQAAKLYYIAIPGPRMKKIREERQEKNPEDNAPSSIVATPEDQITTRIDVTGVLDRKFDAIFAHRSQFAADHWFRRLTPEQRIAIFGAEYFVCAQGCAPRTGEKESDLFSGWR
ncbi:MAG: PIG-L family deacetylase [Desulfobacteraceae bacterium]|nr:PIG-L family deacetylase [Desulfobacteraceae bacterium]